MFDIPSAALIPGNLCCWELSIKDVGRSHRLGWPSDGSLCVYLCSGQINNGVVQQYCSYIDNRMLHKGAGRLHVLLPLLITLTGHLDTEKIAKLGILVTT